ncbi:hypothetical protein U0030_13280 [Brevundimonas bullata]|jgi:hypothetical protein|uniref:hypothetical protein n=1 Tax=Brevundimonas bullata TaxID=13160 RepID=UPI000E0AA3BD|nr:hypothetical protein [Brevundimonas bullata]WQE36231.1 hypothetical protein U0030_13280 [Brevundimonas bullata]
MWILGAFLAGLFLILRELVPLLQARSSGVVYTKGHSRRRVARADDPERFQALCRGRFKAMGLGAVIIAIALAWLAVNLLLMAADAALPAA